MKDYKQQRKEIKTFLAKNYPDNMYVEELDENLLIEKMTRELETEGLISFSFEYRECESDCWLQCEYFSKKLNKTIIWDYDAPSNFDNQDIIPAYAINNFIGALINYEKEIDKFEKTININIKN